MRNAVAVSGMADRNAERRINGGSLKQIVDDLFSCFILLCHVLERIKEILCWVEV